VWVPDAERFLKKWGQEGLGVPFIKNGRWHVIVSRSQREASLALESERERIGHGQNIDLSRMLIESGQGSLQECMRGVLSTLLDHRFPWDV
jgi:hypothetical protein